MNIIRKATLKDIDAVAGSFESVIKEEEAGRLVIGWKRGIYPTRETAIAALKKDDLFVMEDEGVVVAAMRLNQEQVPEYKNCHWEYSAKDDQVMVMHTLVVDPYSKKNGYGRKMINWYESYARKNKCRYLRIDTNVINARARALYKKCGYKEVGITPCNFNGISGVDLVCIEKKQDLI